MEFKVGDIVRVFHYDDSDGIAVVKEVVNHKYVIVDEYDYDSEEKRWVMNPCGPDLEYSVDRLFPVENYLADLHAMSQTAFVLTNKLRKT